MSADLQLRAYLASQIGPSRRVFGAVRPFICQPGAPRVITRSQDTVLYVSIQSTVNATAAISRNGSPSINQDITQIFLADVSFVDIVLLPGEEVAIATPVLPNTPTTFIVTEIAFPELSATESDSLRRMLLLAQLGPMRPTGGRPVRLAAGQQRVLLSDNRGSTPMSVRLSSNGAPFPHVVLSKSGGDSVQNFRWFANAQNQTQSFVLAPHEQLFAQEIGAQQTALSVVESYL